MEFESSSDSVITRFFGQRERKMDYVLGFGAIVKTLDYQIDRRETIKTVKCEM